jgi:DNA-binding NarL/FixJ family response regulator
MRKRPLTIELRPWAYPERQRVLIEHRDPDAGLELAAAIRRAGCTVGICRGPDARAEPATRCPLHGLEPCAVVEGADLIVTALDLEEEESREVLRGLRTRYASTPLVVVATVGETLELGDVLEGCTVVPVNAEPERIVAAVLEALPSDSRNRAAGASN